ncbi:hypothetical protein GCM10022404_28840 [Celeribacter arenosi]|uniref:Uncharacterized protein n=2 Tax=Celeribacter arenosi TaxID=792649 RepID=A0ABP7KI21_9RHOB
MGKFTVREGLVQSEDAEARASVHRLCGRDVLDLADYEAVILTGLQFSVFAALRPFRDVVVTSQPSITDVAALAGGEHQLVSFGALGAMVEDFLSQTPGFALARDIAATGLTQVIIASQPRPSIAAREDARQFNRLRTLDRDGDGAFASQFVDKRAALLCKAAGIRYLPQPGKSITHNLYTRHPFMRGSVRLAAREGLSHGREDVIHANAAFGALVIDDALKTLESAKDAPAV